MAYNADYDYIFKCLLIGNSGVGKSSLMYRLCEETFTETFIPTIGVDFKIKNIVHGSDNTRIKLQIWDTAGQERFQTITSTYYRNSVGIAVVYDITDHESFRDVQKWVDNVEKYASPQVKMLLIGSKNDLGGSREVSVEEGKELAKRLRVPFIETSSKNNENIGEAFDLLAGKILEEMPETLRNDGSEGKQRIKINPENVEENASCCTIM